MYIIRYDLVGGVFGPFDTEESAETYLKDSPWAGRVIEMIQPQSHNAAELAS